MYFLGNHFCYKCMSVFMSELMKDLAFLFCLIFKVSGHKFWLLPCTLMQSNSFSIPCPFHISSSSFDAVLLLRILDNWFLQLCPFFGSSSTLCRHSLFYFRIFEILLQSPFMLFIALSQMVDTFLPMGPVVFHLPLSHWRFKDPVCSLNQLMAVIAWCFMVAKRCCSYYCISILQ